MIRNKNSGYFVRTKSGKLCRTFSNQMPINGKIRVYEVTETKSVDLGQGNNFEIPVKWNQAGSLCDPKSLTVLGLID